MAAAPLHLPPTPALNDFLDYKNGIGCFLSGDSGTTIQFVDGNFLPVIITVTKSTESPQAKTQKVATEIIATDLDGFWLQNCSNVPQFSLDEGSTWLSFEDFLDDALGLSISDLTGISDGTTVNIGMTTVPNIFYNKGNLAIEVFILTQ